MSVLFGDILYCRELRITRRNAANRQRRFWQATGSVAATTKSPPDRGYATFLPQGYGDGFPQTNADCEQRKCVSWSRSVSVRAVNARRKPRNDAGDSKSRYGHSAIPPQITELYPRRAEHRHNGIMKQIDKSCTEHLNEPHGASRIRS